MGKANVGLNDLGDLDSGQDSKLNGVATGATNNGSTVNSSGNVSGTMTIISGGNITVGNITMMVQTIGF